MMTPEQRDASSASVGHLLRETFSDREMYEKMADLKSDIKIIGAAVEELKQTLAARRTPWAQFVAVTITVLAAAAAAVGAIIAPYAVRIAALEMHLEATNARIDKTVTDIGFLRESDRTSEAERAELRRMIAR